MVNIYIISEHSFQKELYQSNHVSKVQSKNYQLWAEVYVISALKYQCITLWPSLYLDNYLN